MRIRRRAVWSLLKETVKGWQEDKIALWAAALAYYTTFSLAPLLVIAIAIAGAVFGEEAAQGEVVAQIEGLIGQQGAEAIQAMLQNANQPGSGGLWATTIGVITLLIGASGVFGQLQEALNAIWHVKPKPSAGIKNLIQDRFLSFAMVLVIGFLLLVSLLLSAVLAAISTLINNFLPELTIAGQVFNFLLSFGVITLLFALIYKVLPDITLPWRYFWIGAAVTALLFNIGKFLIGLYLGSSGIASTYGAAASLAVILIWVYYSAQILLVGAVFTKVYARYRGAQIRPSSHAMLVD
ncbi:MAG: YihY/virulence factor BrkB family protein [Synechococcales cyanobacterium C42_A2020_086]|jgi:membrane protein|nr:YihY/virulence factor BrkB family protein [Synechococcales cyanobacterium C42_A2020_086]